MIGYIAAAGVAALILWKQANAQQVAASGGPPAIGAAPIQGTRSTISSVGAVKTAAPLPTVTMPGTSATVAIPMSPASIAAGLTPAEAAAIDTAAIKGTISGIQQNIAIGVAAEKAAGNYTGFGVPLTPGQGAGAAGVGSDASGQGSDIPAAPDPSASPTGDISDSPSLSDLGLTGIDLSALTAGGSFDLPPGFGSGDIGFGGGPLAG